MKAGFVGMSKISGNVVRHLLEGGHEIYAPGPDVAACEASATGRASTVATHADLAGGPEEPRAVAAILRQSGVREERDRGD